MTTSRAACVSAVIGLSVVAFSCAEPAPELASMTIGVHEVAVELPIGWEHLDHGREQRFEESGAQISLADFGPITSDGFVREIGKARELYRTGQLEDARSLVNGLPLRAAFPNTARWATFETPWNVIRRAGLPAYPASSRSIEEAYTEALVEVRTLPSPSLRSLALATLAELGHNERRDIAHEEAIAVDGRAALSIDTWDRLSHTGRRRHLFVLNEGNLLVLRTETGYFPEMEEAFASIAASLGFRTQR